jgi:glycosyltransferase involved in cell wall biosynthesis
MVSVIIPVLNGQDVIGRQLAALRDQASPVPWEIVVVDNGSTDRTAEVVRTEQERGGPVSIVLVHEPERGHVMARNAGAAAASGDLLLFCDADDEVSPGWITAMVAAAPSTDLLGGRIVNTSVNDDVMAQVLPNQRGEQLVRKWGWYPFATTANFGIHADVLKAVGGFNPDYRMASGDVELCYRAQVQGYTIGYVPDAIVHYRHRSSLKALARQMYRRGQVEVQLYRDFRRYGRPRRTLSTMAGGWAQLVVSLPDLLRGPVPRGRWVKRAATRAGYVRGSIRQRTLFL